MREAAGADQRDALGNGVGRTPERLAERPGAGQRRERRTLAVDVGRHDRQVVVRRQEMQRHRDAVIELPFLGIGDVDRLHHLLDQPSRQRLVAGHRGALDAEECLVLDRAFVAVGHADGEGRHVVHEEVGEVLGRDHHQRVGPGRADVVAHPAERTLQRLPRLGVGALGAAGDAGGMAAGAAVNQGHQRVSRSALRRASCASTPS